MIEEDRKYIDMSPKEEATIWSVFRFKISIYDYSFQIVGWLNDRLEDGIIL